MAITQRTLQILAAQAAVLRLFRPDGFVLALAGVVVASTVIPCEGERRPRLRRSRENSHRLCCFFCRARDYRARRLSTD